MKKDNNKMMCYGCFEKYDEKLDMCPFCGYENDESQVEALHITPGTTLKGTYIIGKVLGYGGFGVTYLAWNPILEQKVAIKEYLPSEFSTRMPGQTQVTIFHGEKAEQFTDGVDKFVEEANRLAQFRNTDGIVRIFECFQENNTAYIVMEFLDGQTLSKHLEETGKLSGDEAIKLLTPIIQSLQVVNAQGIIHRDIAPDNIMITKDGQVKLIDFGAARFATTSHSRSLTVIIKPGYSPEEQYRSRGDHGPWTDVYAIGATLYRMITGVAPPDAMERRAFFEGKKKDILTPITKYSKELSENQEIAVLNAMNVRIEDRTPDAQTFEQELYEEGELERRLSKIKKIDVLKWPLWMKIATPAAACFVVTLALLFATGVIGFSSNRITDFNVPEGMARVPSVVGFDINFAEERSAESNLLLSIVGKEDSDDIPANMILSQAIRAGGVVTANSVLEVVISGGAAVDLLLTDAEGRFFIADVQFRTKEAAIERLELQGMIVVVLEQHDETVAAGIVISQSPVGGTPAFPGTEVTIIVSLGGMDFDMPDVVGMTEEEARAILAAAGLAVEVEYVNVDGVPAGSVVTQNVEAGSAVRRGAVITISVNSNQALIQVPNVVGQQRSDARSTLSGLGLDVMISEGVSDRPRDEVIGQNPQAGTSLQRNGTVVITVSLGQCTIRLDAQGGTVSPDSVSANIGGTVALPTPTRAEHAFVGWFTAAIGGTQITQATVINGDMTAFAHWTQDIYTVTLNANGGTVSQASLQIPGGQSASLPIPARDHHTFDGWFTSASGGSRVDNSTTITESMTVFAQWTRIVRTITLDADGGSVNPRTLSVNSGDNIGTLPTPTRDHFTFDGWFSGGSQVSGSTNVLVDMTLTARWTVVKYTITFDSTGGSNVGSKSVNWNEPIGALTVPARSFYAFNGWFTAANGGTRFESNTPVQGSVTLFAQWSINENWGSWIETAPPIEAPPAPYTQRQWSTRVREWTSREGTTRPSLDGWENAHDVHNVGHTPWSAAVDARTNPGADTDTQRSRRDDIPTTVQRWHYYHWCGRGYNDNSMNVWTSNTGPINNPTSSGGGGGARFAQACVRTRDGSAMPSYRWGGGMDQYSDGTPCSSNGGNWWFLTNITTVAGTPIPRWWVETRSVINEYHYWRWLEWSAWSDTQLNEPADGELRHRHRIRQH